MAFSVGMVGCGGIAQVHAAALAKLSDVRLRACADIVPERAQRMAEAYACRAYASLSDMLAGEKLDAVHICTPHYLHTPMARQIADYGAAVFTEKPPVISRAQWEELCAVAARVPLGVCFQNRYNPNVRDAQAIIASGEYGAVRGARAFVTWSRGEKYYTQSGWRGRWETEGGGVLINQSIHTLDLLVRLLGPAAAVEAHMANHHLRGTIEVEDTLEAYMLLGGKPVIFYATTAYAADAPVLLEVQLEKATLRLEGATLEIRQGAQTERRAYQGPEALGKGYWGNGHQACIADFYDSLAQKRPFANDLASVRATVDAMLAIYAQGVKTL